MLTYQEPQMKYWRNMKIESLVLSAACIAVEGRYGISSAKRRRKNWGHDDQAPFPRSVPLWKASNSLRLDQPRNGPKPAKSGALIPERPSSLIKLGNLCICSQ